MTVYGQTEVTRDHMDAAPSRGPEIIYEASDVALHDIESDAPFITYTKDGATRRIDVPLSDKIEDWPDDRLWDELAVRLGPEAAANITRGPALEKSIAPVRSFVFEPMHYGSMFLAGSFSIKGHITGKLSFKPEEETGRTSVSNRNGTGHGNYIIHGGHAKWLESFDHARGACASL